MTTLIRPATPADIPNLHRLIRGLAEYERLLPYFTVTESQLQTMLFAPNPKTYAFLAEVNHIPAGIALFYYTFNTFRARTNIFLEDLFVDPAYRGQGIGLALMRHLAQHAIDQNCARIDWQVLNWNQSAIDFYQQLGATQMTDWQTRQLSGEALLALAQETPNG